MPAVIEVASVIKDLESGVCACGCPTIERYGPKRLEVGASVEVAPRIEGVVSRGLNRKEVLSRAGELELP
jgi:hypothetical protein